MNTRSARSTGKGIRASLKAGFLLPLLFVTAASPAVMAQTGGAFSATGSMTTARVEHTATLLQDGRVLVAGGSLAGPVSTLASAELYDPSTGIFTAIGDMTAPRRQHSATLLPDGRVLIVGGYSVGNPPLSSAELYDPSSGTFTATGDLLNARGGHAAILLANGKVLIVGAAPYPNNANAELYDPATGTFAATGAYGVGGGDCDFSAAIRLADGTVLFEQQNLAQIYNPVTGTFNLTGATGDCLSPAALLMNGKVLFAGGETDGGGRSSRAELYDPATSAFISIADMTWRREWHTLTPLPDGTVLAAGGETDSCSGNSCMFAGSLASAELYDPSKGAFVATSDMTMRRETHTATMLKDGRVLIAGGVSYGGIGIFFGTTASAEIYCPVNVNCPPDSWQQAITAMKTAAGTDSYNFWQWAWFWQTLPPFSGAPAGFGVAGSISPGLMEQITLAGGGNPLLNVSAKQWITYFRQLAPQ